MQDRHIASGRAARNARNACRIEESGSNAEITLRASACSGGAMSVAPPASSRPRAIASAVPSRNKSSSARRIRALLPRPSSRSVMPRTIATGTPVSLLLTRSAAAAISSATATTVTSRAFPWASTMPRASNSAPRPATPIAASVMPSRQGRPIESLMTTPTSTPARSRTASRNAAAERSGSSGISAISSRATLDSSTPAAASTSPCRVCTMRSGPRWATRRAVSALIASCRTMSRSTGSVEPSEMSRPSTLETAFDVTTRTSPSCSEACLTIVSARSSPGRSSPMPCTGRISIRSAEWSSAIRELQSVADHLRGRVVVGHQQRHRPDGDAVDLGAIGAVHEPSVEQPAVAARAVVAPDALRADLDPDGRQAGVGHTAYRLAADDRRQPDDLGPGPGDRLADARHGEDRADTDDRIARRDEQDVRAGDRLDDARRRPRIVDTDLHELLRRHRRPVLDPPFLEVDRLSDSVDVDDHVRLASLVGHWQERHGRLPSLAQGGRHVREREARVEHPGADEVRGDVEVAEPEPGRFGAVGRELVLDPPGLLVATPAAVGIDAVPERVHDAVEVRADAKAVQGDVVAGVHDRRDVVRRTCRAHAAQETSSADPSGKDRNSHSTNVRDPDVALGVSWRDDAASSSERRPPGEPGHCRRVARVASTWQPHR